MGAHRVQRALESVALVLAVALAVALVVALAVGTAAGSASCSGLGFCSLSAGVGRHARYLWLSRGPPRTSAGDLRASAER
jgi:hypothetical protein